jgi:tight adherence protein C
MEFGNDNTRLIVVLTAWALVIIVGAIVYRRYRQHQESLRRAYSEDDAHTQLLESDLDDQNALTRWLFLAGYRSRNAPALFVLATILSFGLGLLLAILAVGSGFTGKAVAAAAEVPGGIGDLATPILLAGPWIVVILFAMMPWSVVNSTRKRRVLDVESDMPVTLELLATLSEAGLAFDSAVTKVVESRHDERPLFDELKTFQLEVLGGVSRVQCFRRLARRLEVPSMTLFVSALVQAEQVGAGFSKVLRIQADDLRNRRREQANMMAQALTVKLIFPLVICFLPGIFVCTLGPIFMKFVQLADSMSRGGGG